MIEPGAIVCDGSVIGGGCVVRAGAVVKQRSQFAPGTDIDGFPAVEIGRISEPPVIPAWAWSPDDLPVPARYEPMTTVRHLARAVGSTGSTAPAYQVDVRVGAHHLVADEPTITGGGDVGPSPFGLLLAALTACTANTLRMYANRKGWELATLVVDVRYDVDEDRRGSIERTVTVPADLPVEQRERLAEIAERTR